MLLLSLLMITAGAAAADDARSVDVKASRATFTVQHVLITRVTGNVPIQAATVSVAADGVTPTAVEATLDPRRIDTGDGDRDGDLQGSDWFDTKTFPLWTFKSTHVSAKAGNTYPIQGVLTVHGVTVPITLAVSVLAGAPHPSYHATAVIDRHAFGMVVTRTDALVGNEVSIALDVQTNK